jgi:Leucine-rich repeat (LRR) protein
MVDMVMGKKNPEPKTGKKVAAQKIETASKTGLLSLSGHALTEVPSSIWEIEKISTLDLSSNKIETLPGAIVKLKMLKSLKLDKNKLTKLPPLDGLGRLTSLSMGENGLGPGSLSILPQPPKLVKLIVPSNRLGGTVFSDCARVPTLQVLDLSRNEISVVPPSVGELAMLVELLLDDNTIEVVPEEIGKLVKLKTLSLRNNQIAGDIIRSTGFQALPAVLFTDTSLERLNLEGNPILRRELNEFTGVDSWLDRVSKTKQKDLALYM